MEMRVSRPDHINHTPSSNVFGAYCVAHISLSVLHALTRGSSQQSILWLLKDYILLVCNLEILWY